MRRNAFGVSLYPSSIGLLCCALWILLPLTTACYNDVQILVRECSEGSIESVRCDDGSQSIDRVCENGQWIFDPTDCDEPKARNLPCDDAKDPSCDDPEVVGPEVVHPLCDEGELVHEACEGWGFQRTLLCNGEELEDLGCAEVSLSAASSQPNDERAGFCLLDGAGQAHCWGDNSEGQAGRGHADPVDTVALVAGGRSFTAIARAVEHTCAISDEQQLYCWGANTHKQSASEDETPRLVPRAVPGLEDVQQLAVGPRNGCIIDQHAHLYCWGSNAYKQLASDTADTTHIPLRVAALEDVEQVSIGHGLTCAIADTSQLYCWGNNDVRLPSGTPDNLIATPTHIPLPAPVQQVAVGRTHVCALSDGEVYCWGGGHRGQLGHGSLESAPEPVRVALDTPARAIAVGDALSCAVADGGALYCWGQNTAKEIDFSDDAEPLFSAPHRIEGIDDVRSVAIASFTESPVQHTLCAANQDGEVSCWGAQIASSIPHPDVEAPPSAPIAISP